jgi:HAD superfamily hydrolase (TIGR01484 family)
MRSSPELPAIRWIKPPIQTTVLIMMSNTESKLNTRIIGRRPLKGLFTTDLDGTLLRSDRTFAKEDLNALDRLGNAGIVRVLATGRSLYSLSALPLDALPVDYVLFSSGAGVVEHPRGRILRKLSLQPKEVERAYRALLNLGLDFMIHEPIPENHRFVYVAANYTNADFERRISLYQDFALPLKDSLQMFQPASQLLAVVPRERAVSALAGVRGQIRNLNVIRTTSPLDGQSTWIEIFPANVSKSRTAAWLAAELGIHRRNTASVGNDYNDQDLLEWSATGFAVANSPQEFRDRFATVASNDRGGVAQAIQQWLHQKGF